MLLGCILSDVNILAIQAIKCVVDYINRHGYSRKGGGGVGWVGAGFEP